MGRGKICPLANYSGEGGSLVDGFLCVCGGGGGDCWFLVRYHFFFKLERGVGVLCYGVSFFVVFLLFGGEAEGGVWLHFLI